MERSPHALRITAVAVLLATTLLSISLAHGAGGGTSPGTTPAPPPNPPTALRLPVQGALAGQPDGAIALLFKLRDGANASSPVVVSPVLFEESATVSVQAERFTHALGRTTWTGVPSSAVAGTKSLYVTWALASDPDLVRGSQSFPATAYALTLSPGATVEASSSAPAVTVSNSGTAVSAESRSGSGRGVVASASSTYGASFGLEGRAASPSGAGGLFVNTGGGNLIVGTNDGNPSTPAFRVAHEGDVYIQGVTLPERGPKGPVGDKGVKGDKGDKGAPGATGNTGPAGPPGSFSAFCVAAKGSCLGVCTGSAQLVAQAAGPCSLDSCWYNGSDGSCCRCGP